MPACWTEQVRSKRISSSLRISLQKDSPPLPHCSSPQCQWAGQPPPDNRGSNFHWPCWRGFVQGSPGSGGPWWGLGAACIGVRRYLWWLWCRWRWLSWMDWKCAVYEGAVNYWVEVFTILSCLINWEIKWKLIERDTTDQESNKQRGGGQAHFKYWNWGEWTYQRWNNCFNNTFDQFIKVVWLFYIFSDLLILK